MSAQQKTWILLYALPLKLARTHLLPIAFALDVVLFLVFVGNIDLTTNALVFSLAFLVGVAQIVLGALALSRKTDKSLKLYITARVVFLVAHLSCLLFSVVQLAANSNSYVVAFDKAARLQTDAKILVPYLKSVMVVQIVMATLAVVHVLWTFSLVKCMNEDNSLDAQEN